MTKRLTQKERNAIIADFNQGNPTPGYDVIPSKAQKGRYTIRKKQEEKPETPETPAAPETEEAPQEKEEVVVDEGTVSPDDEIDDDTLSYVPSFKLNKNAMFREMQMQMNRLMLEQMKMIRQQQKWSNKKQKKMKDRTKQMYDIISAPPLQEIYEEEDVPEEPVETEQVPVQNTDYFDKGYQNPAPSRKKEPEPAPEPEPIPEKEYQNEYERDLDDMAGESIQYYIPSRNDRYNYKNFPI